MVRIRKKTSRRQSTAHRAKVKHKAAETRKKKRKESKKNPNLHKKKKKDPGIPNSLPFKEQILAEVAETRRLAIEEKRRKQEQKDANPTNDTTNTSTIAAGTQPKAISLPQKMDVDEVPLLIDTTIPTIAAGLEIADVIVHLLDARDPLSFRNISLEESIGTKPLIFVLTKADLAPREAISAWISYLRRFRPSILFRAMSTYRMSEVKAKSKSVAPENDTLGREAFLEILHNVASSNATAELKIAIVGVTNVGKSAFVNSLVGKSALPVYNPTGPKTAAGHSTTPYPQSIILSHKKRKFTLIDTPGLSFIPQAPSTAEEIDQRVARDLLLRNRGNISKIKDPLPAALYILSRASMEDLLMLYNLPAVSSGDYDGFLASLARKEGALQKRGAVVDFQGAARALVRDWKTGRLAFYTFPPRDKSEEVYPTSQVPTKVEISTTYQKHDEKLLGELLSRKELRRTKGTIVQLKGATLDRRRVDLEANAGLSDKGDRDNDDEDEDSMAVDDDEEGESKGSDEIYEGTDDVSGEEEDDEEEEEEEEDEEDEEEEERGDTPSEDDDDGDDSEEMENAPILSGKQKRVAQRHQKPAEKKPVAKKTVSFAAYTKAGAKIKASKNARVIEKKPSPVQRQAPRAGGKKSMTNKQNSDDPDAYDFSKYF